MSRVFGIPTYAQIEQSLRTGDILLYSDADTEFVSRRTRRLLHRASVIGTLLALLPCASHENLRTDLLFDGGVGTDDEEPDNDARGACRLDFEGDVTDLRQAGLILLLADQTHTNPNHDKNKMLPYVFVPTDRAVAPLRDFVEQRRSADPAFCVRRLLLNNENSKEHAYNCSRMRDVLSRRLVDHCVRAVWLLKPVGDEQRCDEQRREWQLAAFLNAESTAIFAAPAPQQMTDVDTKVLLRSNSNYFVLHALYANNIARKLTHSRCATRLLHSNTSLSLSADYRLEEPFAFV